MKNKKLLILLSMISVITLASCEGENVSSKHSSNVISSNSITSSSINKESTTQSTNVNSSTTSSATSVNSSNNASSTSSSNNKESSSETVSSSKTSSSVPSANTYKVTWKNYNGDVLEVDENVEEGSIPTYDGVEPSKEATAEYTYAFNGWDKDIVAAYEDAVYTAVFSEKKNNDDIPSLDGIEGVNPIVSEDGKTLTYGLYPQSHVGNVLLINELNKLSPSNINGWYLYEGDYYTKINAKVYNNETYAFNNGTSIAQGGEYWFKCEPIEWKILNYKDNTFFLVSTMLLDAYNFYKDYDNRTIDAKVVYANNYKESDIRSWLNNDFYQTSFALNNTYIKDTVVDNSTTTDLNENEYVSENTTDKVYLPSYQDYINPVYGFDSNTTLSSSRTAKTTDYTRARGAWYNTTTQYKYNGSYWTRSASSEYYYCAWNVNSGGYLNTYAVDDASHCVRPCITITI